MQQALRDTNWPLIGGLSAFGAASGLAIGFLKSLSPLQSIGLAAGLGAVAPLQTLAMAFVESRLFPSLTFPEKIPIDSADCLQIQEAAECSDKPQCYWTPSNKNVCKSKVCPSTCLPKGLIETKRFFFAFQDSAYARKLCRSINLKLWAHLMGLQDQMLTDTLVFSLPFGPSLLLWPRGCHCCTRLPSDGTFVRLTDAEIEQVKQRLKSKTFVIFSVHHWFRFNNAGVFETGAEMFGSRRLADKEWHAVSIFLYRTSCDEDWNMNFLDPNGMHAYSLDVAAYIRKLLTSQYGLSLSEKMTHNGITVNASRRSRYRLGICTANLCLNLMLLLVKKKDRVFRHGQDLIDFLKQISPVANRALTRNTRQMLQQHLGLSQKLMDSVAP